MFPIAKMFWLPKLLTESSVGSVENSWEQRNENYQRSEKKEDTQLYLYRLKLICHQQHHQVSKLSFNNQMFQIQARLPVRAARSVTVTMIVWTRMARRRDNEDRELTSPPSNSRSWRRCLLATDTQTCQPGRRSPCGPTSPSPESG